MKIFIAILITLASVKATASEAKNRMLGEREKLVFTHNEFRGLSKDKKEQWVTELREFNRKFDLINYGQRIVKKKVKYWGFFPAIEIEFLVPKVCAAFDILVQPTMAHAQATGSMPCTIRSSAPGAEGLICLECIPAGASFGVPVCTDDFNKTPQEMADALYEMHRETNPRSGAKATFTAAELLPKVQTSLANSGKAVPFTAVTSQVSPSADSLSQPATPSLSESAQRDPITARVDQAFEQVNQTAPASTTTLVAPPSTTTAELPAQGSLTAGTETPTTRGIVLPNPNDTGAVADIPATLDIEKSDALFNNATFNSASAATATRDQQIRDNELSLRGEVACFYAGFAVKGQTCAPISEIELTDHKGEKRLMSCKKTPSATSLVVQAGDSSGGKNVMCNPLLFGLKDQKPICIAKAKNATEACTKIAASLDDANAVIDANAEEYVRLTSRIEFLCRTDEATLRAHFQTRGKRANEIDNSIADLAATCVHIQERMSQLATRRAAYEGSQTGTH